MNKNKLVPSKLPPEIYRELEDIVGNEWISQDRAIVETYSKESIDAQGFLKKHLRDPSSIPACVVLPGSTEEIQAIMCVANRHKIPFVAFTNGQMFSTPTAPVPTICIHLSRMNRVLAIDEENMTATLEPYADYGQLLAEAAKVGLWLGGTPLATTLCKLSSQAAFAGIWQTSKKYGLLDRNIVNLKVILPTGEILRTGSTTLSGAKNFWEYGPGPDLFSLVRGSCGTTGIIAEITVKLHTWVGGAELPEPPAGRPFITRYYEPKYDTAPTPPGHRVYWVEFADYDSQMRAFKALAQSGIGIGLNASGVYSAYYCSQTQEMTVKRFSENFFPSWNLYVIIAGITSEKQIAYEEEVLRDIVNAHGGTFLSAENKPEVLEALAPWNLDWVRHVCGFRMNRRTYAGGMFPGGSLDDLAQHHSSVWKEALGTFGETYITDRGGVDNTVFVYAVEPFGRFGLSETDIYPDPMDPASLQKGIGLTLYGIMKNAAARNLIFGFGFSVEPFTTFVPEMGPNAHLFFRGLRRVFDPDGISSPGRQVFTEEELRGVPEPVVGSINQLRQMVGLPPVTR
jgi:hypothetical protein